MKAFISKILCVALIFSMLYYPSDIYGEEPPSAAPLAKNITVTNNVGKADTVVVKNLIGGDIVCVYNAPTGGKKLGTAKVSSGKSEAVVSIPQLGSEKDFIYVTVESIWESESARTKVVFEAEPVSSAPDAKYITITNNAGKADIINIINLYGGETIKVYNAETGGKLLSTTTVAATKSEANISITQLGMEGGAVYITITAKGELESDRVKVTFGAEPLSMDPNPAYIIINNNVGKADTIVVKGLYGGDNIKVYDKTSLKLLGSATASGSKTEVTVTVSQLGISAGYVYISRTAAGERESGRIQVTFPGESQTLAPNASSITVTNNVGIPDTVYVNYLSAGDVVSVYTTQTGGSLLGTATVASSKSEATVSINQVGKTAGTVYVSVTSKGMNESSRVAATFTDEGKSAILNANNITIVNNTGKADTITVSDLTAGDIIKAYHISTGAVLGTATVASSKTEATISVPQLGTAAGAVYVTIASKGKYESDWMAKSYSAEANSSNPSTSNIVVTNNSGKSDTVYVSNLNAGDVVKVYDKDGVKLLGSATVASSKTEATVSIAQLGTSSGVIQVSITSTNSTESSKTIVAYSGEGVTDILDINNITVINNPAGKSDTVNVFNLTGGDVIKVYNQSTGGSLLGSATVSSSATEATITITQLGTDAGSVYVSLTSTSKLESSRLEVKYSAESKSDTLNINNIVVTNNKGGTADTVEVTSLTVGDVIKVYDSASGGKLLGSATVAAYESSAKVSITQLGTEAGSVYVTVTGIGKLESSRQEATYEAEAKSAAPKEDNIFVTNNAVGINDTIEVTGLLGEDIIKVYSAEKGGSLLGTATVAAGSTYNTVSIAQLGTNAGTVYVTVTSKNKLESSRTKATYLAESKSGGTSSDDIVIINNAGSSDVIQLKNLSAGDTVKVYDLEKGGSVLGSTTVTSGSTAAISVPQLGTGEGYVYISITSKNKLESDRVKVKYDAEAASTAIKTENVVISNNVGVTDTIKVAGVSGGDVVNVYDSETVGNLLGTATATTYQTSVTIEVTQLGIAAGDVYITVTSKNKQESSRVAVGYAAEAKSGTLTAANVVVANNAGMSDTIKVTGLSANDIINVYDASQITLLGTATVAGYDTSATVTVSQLGSEAGTIYISLTEKGKQESGKLKVDYAAEPQSSLLSASNVVITNNAGISDVIKVTGLKGGDVVAVYDAQTAGTQLGTATVGTYDSYATVTVSQLGSEAGKVYVSLTQKGKQESQRVEVNYGAEPKTGTSDASNIIVTNNAGASDIIQINGLTGGDVVNIYSAATGGSLIATATVGTYDSYAKITVSQLGSTAGNIYVSVTSKGKNESERTTVAYAAEQKTDAPAASNVTITNNANLSDVVVVSFLEVGDVVKIYNAATGGTLMGSGTVPSDSEEVTVKVTQLGSSSGTAYISVTGINKLESDRTAVVYSAEATTTVPDISNIKIVNNVKLSDTITVTFLEPDDVLKVYNAATGGSLLGYVTVASDATQATVSISQLGTTAGSVYVSVTSKGKKESARVKADYNAEQKSDSLSISNINIYNNAGMADLISISFLDNGDVVKVYDAAAGGNLLISGTVSSSSTSIDLKVSQLGSTAGSVYISVTSYGKLESDRVQVQYIAEQKTDAPDVSKVVITNNTGKSDTIVISGLTEFDVVKIYSAATDGTLLGTGTVAEGNDEITIKIGQLGTAAGSVYISVTSYGAIESNRTKVTYSAEN